MKKHNYMFRQYVFFFFLSNEKNVVLLKEREKERKKIKEKDKVVGPWEKKERAQTCQWVP